MTTTRQLCKAKRRDGLPCNGWAVSGSEFCLSHAPERAGQMAAARSAGGRARHGRRIGATGSADPVNLVTPGDVLRILASELQNVLGLEVSLSRARAVVAVCDSWVATWGGTELEKRVSALEGRANERA